MFGKRAKNNQSQDENFEGEDFSSDFASADAQEDDAAAEWADSSDGAGSEDAIEPELQDRRRSGSALATVLPWAAVGVVVALGGGYYYLSGQKSAVAPAPVAVTEPVAETPVEVAAAPEDITGSLAVEPLTEATGDAAPPVTAPEVASAPTDIEAPVALTPAETTPLAEEPAPVAVAEPPETVIATMAEPTEPTPAPEPVFDRVTPPAVEEKSATPVAPAIIEQQPPVAAAPTPALTVTPDAVAAPQNSEEVADLSQRLAVLERQIDDMTKAIDGVVSQPAPAPVAATDNALKAEVADLKSTITSLQKEISSLKTAVAARPAAPAAAPAAPATGRVATTSAPRPATPRVAAPAPATAPQTNWVLRAAQGNEAWVSRSSEGELKRVTIGETLPGVGKITSIRTTANGRWEIVGSQGSIRQ